MTLRTIEFRPKRSSTRYGLSPFSKDEVSRTLNLSTHTFEGSGTRLGLPRNRLSGPGGPRLGTETPKSLNQKTWVHYSYLPEHALTPRRLSRTRLTGVLDSGYGKRGDPEVQGRTET